MPPGKRDIIMVLFNPHRAYIASTKSIKAQEAKLNKTLYSHSCPHDVTMWPPLWTENHSGVEPILNNIFEVLLIWAGGLI